MIDLTNRQNCFYWQTDRDLSPENFEKIFLNRHQISDAELIAILKRDISLFPTNSLKLIPADENVVKGNVNIVRKVIINEKEYVVRMHPKGVKNGYFYVEKTALEIAQQHNLPVPEILEVHEAENEEDMDFVLMTSAPGVTMDVFLSKDKENEADLLQAAGIMMAKLHQITVEGFGCFDNEIAKNENKLTGFHKTNKEFIQTALDENLQRLIRLSVSTEADVKRMKNVMEKYSFEPLEGPVMVHNDFADWNLLTDGKAITGVLDWDECCGGDAVADLACWSMFFNLGRYDHFLTGYTSVHLLPQDYEKRFHYYRLRYAISKMALRAKRFLVDKSDFMRDKIEIGKKALIEELAWFEE